VAADNRRIAKLVTVGQTVQGKDIIALKVTRNADTSRDGSKPAVLYLGAQHAREWITPEMVRRLMHHMVDGFYRGDKQIRRLLSENELWFLPVANPDGYDFTFQDGQRLWRKNLRDNNGNGEVGAGDGVDLNRNLDYKWGYDNEGSSPDPSSETYRGDEGNSEPETQALDRFAARIGFEFFVNYHSAAQLLLYGTGWQVATPTPDHVIYEAMAGNDQHPAVPGYDPDVSAEL
jgi:murein tripeptide amidase MpaA